MASPNLKNMMLVHNLQSNQEKLAATLWHMDRRTHRRTRQALRGLIASHQSRITITIKIKKHTFEEIVPVGPRRTVREWVFHLLVEYVELFVASDNHVVIDGLPFILISASIAVDQLATARRKGRNIPSPSTSVACRQVQIRRNHPHHLCTHTGILPAAETLELTFGRNEIREQLTDTSLRIDLVGVTIQQRRH